MSPSLAAAAAPQNSGSALACALATRTISAEGSTPVTDLATGSRARLSARIPPPQPTSRKSREEDEDEDDWPPRERHRWMKPTRTGFIRCSSRLGPCASHHVEARALKCSSSFWSAVLLPVE